MNSISQSLGIQGGLIDLNSSSVSPRVKEAILRTMNGGNEPGDESLIDGVKLIEPLGHKKAVLDESFFN